MMGNTPSNQFQGDSPKCRMRGGAFHWHLVQRVCAALWSAGFDTSLEHPCRLDDGRIDFVDILAVRDGHTLACEIETTPRYAKVNITKAIALDLPLLVIVPNRQVRTAVKRLRRRVQLAEAARIWILLPDEVRQGLTECFPGLSIGE